MKPPIDYIGPWGNEGSLVSLLSEAYCLDNCSIAWNDTREPLEATAKGLLGLPGEAWERDTSGLCGAVWASDVPQPSPLKGVRTSFAVVGPDPETVLFLHWLLAVILRNLDLVEMVLCCKAFHLNDSYAEARRRMRVLSRARLGLVGAYPVGDDLQDLHVDPRSGERALEKFMSENYWEHFAYDSASAPLPEIFLDTIAEVEAMAVDALGYYDPAENIIVLPYDEPPFRGGIAAFTALPMGAEPELDDDMVLALNILVHELFHYLLPDLSHVEFDWDPRSTTKEPRYWPAGSPYDFRSCDVVNAAANAFTWALVARHGLTSLQDAQSMIRGRASPNTPLAQFFDTSSIDGDRGRFYGLWGFPGRLARPMPFIVWGARP